MTPMRRGLPQPATAGVRVTADRHFRRPDVRPNRRRRWALTWRRALVLGVAALGLLTAAGWAARRIIASPALAVQHISVHGNSRLSTRNIEALIGDIRGASILRVDLDRYRRRLLDAPWVASATLSRVLPSTVDVQVVESEPMALARQEELLYLVDDLGNIIDEFGPQYAAFDLPVVDGLLPLAGGAASAADAQRVRLTAQFLAAIAGAPEFKSRVSQADVSDAHDVVAILDGDPTLLHLGDRQFVDRLRRYVELAPSLRERFVTIASADLRFDERVFVRKGR